MAFDITTFAPIGGQASRGKAPQMFSYITADALGTIDTAGYFNDISDKVEIGDVIMTIVTSSGTPATAGFMIVQSNASGVVDVSDASALTNTTVVADSD